MKYLKIVILIIIVNMIVGCGSGLSSKMPPLLPESDEIQGWQKRSETRTFDASNLWDYINGGAEKYTQVGLIKMVTTRYLYQQKIESVADIYEMSSAENAQQIFESESPIDSLRVKLGNDAQLSRNSLIFWKGSYFVRIVAFQDAPETAEAVMTLGREIELRIRNTL